MILQTVTEISPLEKKLTYRSKIFFFGSCFATEIGETMQSLNFDVRINPFGVLYNPASIASSISRLSSRFPFAESDIVCSQGRYTSFFHHSSFDRDTPEEFLENANRCLAEDSALFAEADTCIVTLGTAWVFRHTGRNIIVSNCHKIPASDFRRERLSVEEVESYLESFVSAHPEKQWIFTVSPIRHLKDTAHGNQLSKATLLLAIDYLSSKYNNVYYFPAYEIMMDELRDYRFYQENMTHPTPQAVKYIFDRFADAAIDSSCIAAMAAAEKELRRSRHVPLK